MSSLYQLSTDFRQLYDSLEAIEESEGMTDDNGNPVDLDDMRQAWFDTLEGIEMEAEDKLENLGKIHKQLVAEAKSLKAESDSLKARASAKTNAAERICSYINMCMQELGLKKLDRLGALIKLRDNQSVGFDNEANFIEWAKNNNGNLLTVKTEIKPDKNAIKRALKAGEDVPGAKIVTSTSVSIK